MENSIINKHATYHYSGTNNIKSRGIIVYHPILWYILSANSCYFPLVKPEMFQCVFQFKKLYHFYLPQTEFQNLTAQKQEAEDAMKQVDEIQKIIDEAKRVTAEARSALGAVEADAKKANEIAKQAMEKATAASEVSCINFGAFS